jgi:hypothetical protein
MVVFILPTAVVLCRHHRLAPFNSAQLTQLQLMCHANTFILVFIVDPFQAISVPVSRAVSPVRKERKLSRCTNNYRQGGAGDDSILATADIAWGY